MISTIVSLVVVIAMLVPPAVSKSNKDAHQVIEVAATCARKCRDLCAILPKSEDPICDQRCDSMSIFNTSVVDHAALHSETGSIAVQEIQMCSIECNLWCIAPEAASNCKHKCAASFCPFGSTLAALDKTMTLGGLTAPEKPLAPGKDNSKPAFEACNLASNRKCAATASGQGKTKACGGSCVEACGFYSAATRVLQDAMLLAAVPSPAAVGDDTIAKTFKACSGHCAPNDKKCTTKCAFAGYVLNKAKASMKLATGGFGLPA